MEKELLRKVETIREDMMRRMDGGSGSGNWGHVGRPGERGGSESGGGLGFRLFKTSAKKYTSQAKMRDSAKRAYGKAKASGNKKAMARIEKRMSRINMNVKSADKSRAGQKGYQVVKKIDKNASQNILSDKNRGAKARESNVSKVSGTREAIRYTFPNRTTRGGSGSRGGKTTERRSKK